MSNSEIVNLARGWIGTPYVHQSCAKHHGADCLGLVRGVYQEYMGTSLPIAPDYSPDWAERKGDEALLTAAQRHLIAKPKSNRETGDVLLFRMHINGPCKHMGIMSAENRFIHAYAGRHVAENFLSRYWLSHLAAVFAFPEK